ncbi:MAG: caspase family protein [Hyphomicrobiales bacterium]
MSRTILTEPGAGMGRRLILATLALLAAVALSGSAFAAAGKRVALVIGNSAYQHTSELRNPAKDANGMADALARLGFDVIKGVDLDINGMRNVIREYSRKIEGADVALFYYAGHALQIDGKNQLAPVNARLSNEADVDFETLPLNFVLRQMERERRTNLVFLDACRDNPLATRLDRSIRGRSSASVERGLARVESGVGTLIAYATSPGMVAYDGSGDNSPYTKALLSHIEQPGVTINDMMIAVRQDVLADSGGKQIPWEHSSLTGQFYFKQPVKVAAVEPKPEPAPAPAVKSNLEEQKFVASSYQAAAAVGTCGAYRAFEEQHRGSYYARLAEEWIKANCEGKRAVTVEAAGADDKAPTIAPPIVPEAKPAEPAAAPVAAAPEPATPEPAGSKPAEPKPVQVAAAPAAAPDPAPAPETKDVAARPEINLVLELQKELDRVGCNPGHPDGQWGGRTRTALQAFVAQTRAAFSAAEPSEAAYEAVKAHQGRACVVAVAPAPVKQVSPAPQRAAPAPRQRREKIDEYWGGEDTRIDCEIHGIMSACMKKQR